MAVLAVVLASLDVLRASVAFSWASSAFLWTSLRVLLMPEIFLLMFLMSATIGARWSLRYWIIGSGLGGSGVGVVVLLSAMVTSGKYHSHLIYSNGGVGSIGTSVYYSEAGYTLRHEVTAMAFSAKTFTW